MCMRVVPRTVLALWLGACSRQPQPVATATAADCPHLSLTQQLIRAHIVAEGRVTYDRECQRAQFDGGRPFLDCVGRRADVVVSKVWKGALEVGDGLGLVTPAPAESAGMNLRKGDLVILFVRTPGDFHPRPRTQWGFTDACMQPREFADRRRLAKALDSLRAGPDPH